MFSDMDAIEFPTTFILVISIKKKKGRILFRVEFKCLFNGHDFSMDRLASFFCKGAVSKYFRFCRDAVSVNYSRLEILHKQTVVAVFL